MFWESSILQSWNPVVLSRSERLLGLVAVEHLKRQVVDIKVKLGERRRFLRFAFLISFRGWKGLHIQIADDNQAFWGLG